MTLATLKKRKLPIFTIGTLCFLVLSNAYLGIFRYPFLQISPYEAVPAHSAMLYETEVAKLSTFLEESKSFPLQHQIQNDFDQFKLILGDSVLHHQEIQTVITPQKVGATELGFLYIFDVRKSKIKIDSIETLVKPFIQETNNFLGKKYVKLGIENGPSFLVHTYRNLILVSKYPVPIEDGIRQLKDYKRNITRDTKFEHLAKVNAKKKESAIYVNFKNLPPFLTPFFKNEHRDLLQMCANLGTWMSFNLNQLSDLKLSGEYLSNKTFSKDQKIKNLRDLDIYDVLPDNTGFVYARQGLLRYTSKFPAYKNYVAPWVSNEWAFAVMNPNSSADRLLIMRSKDAEYAQHYLEKYGKVNGELYSATHQMSPIVQLVEHKFLAPFEERLKVEFNNPFYTIVGRYVVFSNSRSSLETVVDKHIVGQTLAHSEDFLAFANEVDDNSSSLIYFDGNGLIQILSKMLKEEVRFYTYNNLAALDVDGLNGGLRFYKTKGKKLFTSIIKKKKAVNEDTDIVWRVAFAGNVSSSPKPIWNPNIRAFEILVQDDLSNLYLLNSSGEVRWRRSLKSPMLSEVHEIDYYENGTKVFLFNTAHNIYLVDREGRDIGNFPLRLQSPATNGMCVVDFMGTRQYKFFLACENGHAYGFTKEGSPVFGWNPKTHVGRVFEPFQHFQQKGKDYLVILNDHGKLLAFNKTGNRAFRRVVVGKKYNKSPEILNLGKRKVIALANEEGNLKIVNNRGYSYNLKLKKDPSADVKLAFANLTGDPAKDFLTLDKNKVRCFYQDKNKVKEFFEIDLQRDQDELFEVKAPKVGYSLFGTLNKKDKKINLFNAQNTLHKGFPLAGTTPFSMIDMYGNDSNILLVGYENAVFAYQISDLN